MKIVPYVLATMMITGYAGVISAEETTPTTPQPNPMMYGPGPQGQPMPPQMREQMMRMRQQRQMMMQQQQAPTAEPGQAGTMPMPPGPMAGKPYYCRHMGGQGMRGERINMMRERMERMEQHMQNVDKHLTNIEALMKEMVEKMK